MPSEDSVVSELRAALLSSKTPLSIQEVNWDFKNLNGYSIPFKEFGHKSLEEFLTKLKDKGEITMEYESGHLMVHAIPKGASAHVTHLISKQKTTKKKTSASVFPEFSIDILRNTSNFIPEREVFSPTENLFSSSLQPGSSFSNQVAAFCSEYSGLHNDCMQGNSGSLQEQRNSDKNLVPLNLFQDSYNLKLDTLPSHHKILLENLISKINYQINYFSLDSKTRSNKVKLTCKLCCITLHIRKVEKHILEQGHLRNLTKRCKTGSKSVATAAIDEKNWDFLNFDESSQCYQCTLCNVNLSESRASWNKHFQSGSHRSKLEALKPEVPLNPVSVTSSSKQTDFNSSSFKTITQFLNDGEKKALKAVKRKLKDDINYFKPLYKNVHGSGKLYLICKVCKVSLLPKNVKSHVSTHGHLASLEKNLPVVKCTPAERRVNSSKPLNPFSEVTQFLNDKDKKVLIAVQRVLNKSMRYFEPICKTRKGSCKLYSTCKVCRICLLPKNVRPHIATDGHLSNVKETPPTIKCTSAQKCDDSAELSILPSPAPTDLTSAAAEPVNLPVSLTDALKNSKNNLEPSHEQESNRPCFSCPICSISFSSKHASLHVYSDTHLRNLRKSLSVAVLEASDARNKKIAKDVIHRFNNRMYFFQLIRDDESNELYFVCKVCTKVLVPEDVENHIYSPEHSENVQANPVVLDFHSLSDCNRCIVKELATTIKNRIQDFTFVYRIGTETLRFYCKYCQSILIPEKVEDHIRLSDHMKAVSVQASKNNDTTDTNSQGQISECEAQTNPRAPPEITCDRLCISGEMFDVWSLEKMLMHQNLSTSSFDLKKKITEMFKCDFNLISKYFDFLESVDSKKLYFKCKLCEVHLRPALVVSHMQVGRHLKNLTLNSYLANFQGLEKSTKYILKGLFYKIGEELNNFSLLPDSGGEKPQFKCKYCEVTLFSDHVANHLQTEEHQKCINESGNCTTANLKTSLQLLESKNNVDSDHMKAVSIEPSESHATTEDSNLQRQIVKCDAQHNSTVSPDIAHHSVCFNGIVFEVWSVEEILTHQSPSSLSFDAMKTIVGSVKCDFNLHSKYFDLLYSVDPKKCYFKCKLCDTYLRPAQVANHTQVGKHLKNLTLNSYFENFLSLDRSTVWILTGLFYDIGEKLNNFFLIPDSGSEKPQFKCKFCKVTLFSDFVANHLQTEEHQKCISESGNCTAANLETSSQLLESKNNVESEPINHKIVKNIDPAVVSSEIPSSPTLKNLHENTSDLNFDSVRNSVEGVSKGKIAETALPSVENCAVFKVDAVDGDTTLQATFEMDDFESKRTLSPPNHTDSIENTSEPKIGILSNGSKEILKTLIDKEGIKISHFDFVFKNSSDELHLKCKFCGVIMGPETAENHVNSEEHEKFSQLSNMPNLRFESLKDNSKKLVRKLFDEIGTEINDFDVPFCFVCKVCGANMSPESVINHVKSEDHLKHSLGRSSGDSIATDVCDAKNSQCCQNDAVNIEKSTHETFSHSDDHRPVLVKLHQSVNDRNFKTAKSCNRVTEKTCDKLTQTSVDIIPANTATAGKFQSDSEIPRADLLSTVAENNHRKIQENIRVNPNNNSVATLNMNKAIHVLGGLSGENDLISSARDQKLVQRSLPSEDKTDFDNYRSKIINRSEADNVQFLFCLVCNEDISSKDLQIHVISKDHVTLLGKQPSPSERFHYYDYYSKIVQIITGILFFNVFDILYKLPQKKLHFYCKVCNLILSAESLEIHVSRIHSNNSSGKYQVNHTENISGHLGVNAHNFATGDESQFNKFNKFFCEPCHDKVYLKDVADHVVSEEHIKSLRILNNDLKFNSFIAYKDRVLETLAHSKHLTTKNFEFFSEINSPKCSVYCKPCEVLLRPEYLDQHVNGEHFYNLTMKWKRENCDLAFHLSREAISKSVAHSPVDTSTG